MRFVPQSSVAPSSMIVVSHMWLFELKLNMERVSGTSHAGQVFRHGTVPLVQRVLLDRPSPLIWICTQNTVLSFGGKSLVTVKLMGLKLKQNNQLLLKTCPNWFLHKWERHGPVGGL